MAFKGKSLNEWQKNSARQTVKVVKRKNLTKGGTYNFNIKKVKFNDDETRFVIIGVPFRINKEGEIIEYVTIRMYLPIEDSGDEEDVRPFRELCEAIGFDPTVDINWCDFKNKTVKVELEVVDYTDETGEVTARFFNPDRFLKYQE